MRNGLRALPIVHGSVEFTKIVREIFLHSPPAHVMLELPESMTEAVRRAAPFIEDMPVITSRQNESGLEYHFIMEPLEPLVEAIRNSYELEIPYSLIDTAAEDIYLWSPDSFPDTYSLNVMTPPELYAAFTKNKDQFLSDSEHCLPCRIV